MKNSDSSSSYLEMLGESYQYPPFLWTMFQYSDYGDLAFLLSVFSKAQKKEFTNNIKKTLNTSGKKIKAWSEIPELFNTLKSQYSHYDWLFSDSDQTLKVMSDIDKRLKNTGLYKENFLLNFLMGKHEINLNLLEDNSYVKRVDKNFVSMWKAHLLFHCQDFSQSKQLCCTLKTNSPEEKFQLLLIDLSEKKYSSALSKIRNILRSSWRKSFRNSLYLQTNFHFPENYYRFLKRVEGALILKTGELLSVNNNKPQKIELDDLSFRHLKAEIFLREGEISAAETVYRQLLKNIKDPNLEALTLNNLAYLVAQHSEYQEACYLLQKAVHLEPENTTFVNNLARLYSHRNIHKLSFINLYSLSNKEDFNLRESQVFKCYKIPLLLSSNNKEMAEIYNTIKKVSESDINVLIHGENGSGKEITARYLHACSNRRNDSFEVIDCSAIPESLIESELFGYEKGAFTGADRCKQGKVEKAKNGSLFLDGITYIPYEVQAKLLRFIQHHEFTPLGAENTRKVDVRIIASMNTDLKTALHEGYLREDLYFRLNVLNLHMSPLRKRSEDIMPLFKMFLEYYSELYEQNDVYVSDGIKTFLFQNAWHGNIRELQNFTERIVLLGENEAVRLHKLEETNTGKDEELYTMNLQELENTAIKKALEVASSKKQAADLLGIDTSTLWRKLNKQKGRFTNKD